MTQSLMHRAVVLAGMIVAVASMVYNMATGADLLYAAFCALCVFMGVSLALLLALRSIAAALLRHLKERQRMQQEAVMEAMRKQAAKEQKSQG